MCKTIKQKVKFNAPPREIYALLVDEKQKVGGKFRARASSGINVDLAPGKRVVRALRDADYPEGVFSMAAFVLRAAPGGGTELTLTHRGVPKELIPRTEERWRREYWDRFRARFRARFLKSNREL